MNAATRRYLLAQAQEAAQEFPAAIEPPLALGLRRYRTRLLRVFAVAGVLSMVVFGVLLAVHPTTVAALEILFPTPATSDAYLNEISVTPSDLTVEIDKQSQVSAEGRYSDDTTGDLTAEVKWTSGSPAVVAVDANGLVSAVSSGSAVITAALGTIQGSTTVTVPAAGTAPPSGTTGPETGQPKIQTGITILPESVILAPGETQLLEVHATFSDGTTATAAVSGTPKWDTDNNKIARVDEAGLLTAGPFEGRVATSAQASKPATTTVRAELDGFTDPMSVTVDPLKNFTLTVTGDKGPLDAGETLQLTATLSNGQEDSNVTTDVTWASSSDKVASVNDSGIVTAGRVEVDADVIIFASWRVLKGSVTVEVIAPSEVDNPDPLPKPILPTDSGGSLTPPDQSPVE